MKIFFLLLLPSSPRDQSISLFFLQDSLYPFRRRSLGHQTSSPIHHSEVEVKKPSNITALHLMIQSIPLIRPASFFLNVCQDNGAKDHYWTKKTKRVSRLGPKAFYYAVRRHHVFLLLLALSIYILAPRPDAEGEEYI